MKWNDTTRNDTKWNDTKHYHCADCHCAMPIVILPSSSPCHCAIAMSLCHPCAVLPSSCHPAIIVPSCHPASSCCPAMVANHCHHVLPWSPIVAITSHHHHLSHPCSLFPLWSTTRWGMLKVRGRMKTRDAKKSLLVSNSKDLPQTCLLSSLPLKWTTKWLDGWAESMRQDNSSLIAEDIP